MTSIFNKSASVSSGVSSSLDVTFFISSSSDLGWCLGALWPWCQENTLSSDFCNKVKREVTSLRDVKVYQENTLSSHLCNKVKREVTSLRDAKVYQENTLSSDLCNKEKREVTSLRDVKVY